MLKTSSFYRLYVHWLYKFGVLPAKNEYKELTPAYFKQKRENGKIFEELNFLARNNFESIQDVKDLQNSYESELPKLKNKRENLWRKYNRTTDIIAKSEIKQEIEKLSENIKTIHNNCNVCGRCIVRLENFKKKYIEQKISKEKAKELMIEEKKKKSRNR